MSCGHFGQEMLDLCPALLLFAPPAPAPLSLSLILSLSPALAFTHVDFPVCLHFSFVLEQKIKCSPKPFSFRNICIHFENDKCFCRWQLFIANITISRRLWELKISIRQVAEITGLKYIEHSKIKPYPRVSLGISILNSLDKNNINENNNNNQNNNTNKI